MSVSNTLEKLFSLHQFGVKLGLDNIQGLLTHIGNPEKELKAFHIAGSNGKGSTASFMASILTEAGYKTGLYTSPHFIEFNERVRIDGETIPNEYVVNFADDLWEYIEEHSITFFEVTTALAFRYFADSKVDYAVIETGLGGRLDATNVLNPLACIITTISLEHTNILGDNILDVAEEKAGIFKRGVKIFTGHLTDPVMDLYKGKADQLGSEIFNLNDHAESGNDSVKIKLYDHHLNLYNTPLSGRYQLDNCALAVITLSNCIEDLQRSALLKGIENVTVNSGVQGRYEIYSDHPRVIFDSAHNEDGINAFLSEFSNEREKYSNSTLIIGLMRDKNVSDIAGKLAAYFDSIYAASIDYERAFTVGELIDLFKQSDIVAEPMAQPAEYIEKYISTPGDECLVILGSIYLLGDIKKQLSGKRT